MPTPNNDMLLVFVALIWLAMVIHTDNAACELSDMAKSALGKCLEKNGYTNPGINWKNLNPSEQIIADEIKKKTGGCYAFETKMVDEHFRFTKDYVQNINATLVADKKILDNIMNKAVECKNAYDNGTNAGTWKALACIREGITSSAVQK